MKTKEIALFFTLFITCILVTPSDLLGQKSKFTSEDALRMESFRISDITDDGKYLVGTISSGHDRLNVDHSRFGDPSYVNPRKSQVVLKDVDKNKTIPVFDDKIIVARMKLSPDNKSLALLYYDGESYKIALYDLHENKLLNPKVNSSKKLSPALLEWTPDNQNLILSFRESGWKEKADSMYNEATKGPITVYDSNRPFLKWDEIQNFSSLNLVAKLNLKSGDVMDLLHEGKYSSLQLTKNGKSMTFQESFPLKTSYNRKGGSENSLMMLDWTNPDGLDTLVPKKKERIHANWNKNKDFYAYADSGRVYIRSIVEKEAVRISSDTTEIYKNDTSKIKFSINRWSPDGKFILASSKTGYWMIDIDKKTQEMVYEYPKDKEKAPSLSIIHWTPDGRYWYMSYSAKDKWERGLVKYDLESKEKVDIVKDVNLYSGWRVSEDGNRIFYNFSDGDRPSELFFSDPDLSNPVQLTDMNPWIKDKKLTKSELIKYRDTDGKELYGVLYYPVDYEEGKTYPLVCEIYEKFFSNGFNSSMNLIANEGFFGFRPSVNLIQGYPGEAWIKGITSGINKLIDRGLVDPDKLGVHGTSYGGYATSLIITQTDRFKAAINISGKVNIISFLGDSPKIGTRNYAAAEVGQDKIGSSLWEAPMKYFATSAVLYADRITTPHMILTGEGDWNVPGTNSRELYYAMRRLGKEVIWINYVNGGHGAGRASNEADYHDQVKRMMDFYREKFEEEEKKK